MKRKTRSTVFNTLLISGLLIAVTGVTLFASSLLTGEVSPKSYPKGIPAPPAQMRAFTVLTGSDPDFPSAPGLSAKAQQEQLEGMVRFAAEYGFNTIFFEAVPGGDAFYRSELLPASAYWMGKQGAFTFFDPLGYLTNIAKQENIQVFALVDPFSLDEKNQSGNSPAAKNPDWVTADGFLDPAAPGVQKLLGEISAELTDRYDIAGVLLHQIDDDRLQSAGDYAGSLEAVLERMHGQLSVQQQRLGIVAASSAAGDPLVRSLLSKGKLDFVVTTDSPDPLTEQTALEEQLAQWQQLTGDSNAAYYPMHRVDDTTAFAHRVDNAGYFEQQYASGGVVVSRYGTLDTDARLAAISLASTFAPKPAALPALDFPQEFAITRPLEYTSLASGWSTYQLYGTSDPAYPVVYQGKELERSPGGLWSVLLELDYGENTFSFAQNGVTKSVTIKRAAPSTDSSIAEIVKSSVYPFAPEMVLRGEKLSLSCTAPAGGVVTATVGGLSVELQAPAADKGAAVTYQAKLDLSGLAVAGQVKGIGEVSYQLSYDGLKSFQKSAGIVYLAGEGAVPVAKMNSFASMVNKTPANDGDYISILRKDCVDVITENIGSYYGLSMGGYILKSAVDIPEGNTAVTSKVSKIAVQQTDKGEKLVISNDRRPAYIGTLDEQALTVTLFHTTGWQTMNPLALQGELFEEIRPEIDEEKDSVTLTFTLKENADLFGWDVSFEGDEMAIYLRRRPTVNLDEPHPLANVRVVLDPGHGGADPGALGIPGTQGAAESLMNLANAYSIKSRLESMGAQVHMVHENSDVSLNGRLEFAQKMDADIFISSHHNSVALSSDGATASGIEVYYWNDASADFAQTIGQNLSAQSGRKFRGIEQSFYRVTMMTGCPAVLVESGFLCNPPEYESMTDPYSMFRYGNAVADAVLAYFLPLPEPSRD